ncbi:MAG TPA: CsbD family protein [Acetobacteraceae bacterium]|nr:CsbD family protein [Acetobacteraceae bacterium]
MSDRLAGTAPETGGRVQQNAGEAAGDAKLQAEGLCNQAAGTAQQLWGQAQEATGQVSGAIRAQPLVAAAVALGLGYILGRLTT